MLTLYQNYCQKLRQRYAAAQRRIAQEQAAGCPAAAMHGPTAWCQGMRCLNNQGVTLIELLIGISVLTVVGLMVSQVFGSATRMYHSTIIYADIQTESQSVSRRLSSSLMNASNLYLEENEEGLILFTGARADSTGGTSETGDLFWFNKTTGCLYLNVDFSYGDSSKNLLEESEGEDYLTVETVRDAIENSTSNGRQYLLSDKVETLDVTLTPLLSEMNRQEDTYFYTTDKKVTVNYTITMKYLDSSEYTVSSSTTPRNRVKSLRWNPLNADETRTGEE